MEHNPRHDSRVPLEGAQRACAGDIPEPHRVFEGRISTRLVESRAGVERTSSPQGFLSGRSAAVSVCRDWEDLGETRPAGHRGPDRDLWRGPRYAST